ncbi:hypothetical protein COU79_00325 [Candidatus Peregrinibacteria bacterium CG10_big_fil_rev_8_21_14_0_10_54_7]|nr:MAG: hypothetical protein COU79_00325 [Candidatus Peregrinibacteria bacterium CG10_big_fil_rev_8_21_14_0_10_54_7]
MHIHIFREQRLLWNVENASEQVGNVNSEEDSPQYSCLGIYEDVTDSWETLPQGESIEHAVSHKAEEEVQKIQNWKEIEEAENRMREERQKPLRENIDQTVANLRNLFEGISVANEKNVNDNDPESDMTALGELYTKLQDHEKAIKQVWEELGEQERQELEQKIASVLPHTLYYERPHDENVDGVIHKYSAHRNQGELQFTVELEYVISAKWKQFVQEKENVAYNANRKLNHPDLRANVDAVSAKCRHVDLTLLPGTGDKCEDAGCYTIPAEKGDDLIVRMPVFYSTEVQERAYERFNSIMDRGWSWHQGGINLRSMSPEVMPEVLDRIRQFDDELDTLLKLHATAKVDTSGLRGILIPKREEVGMVFERFQSDEQKELLKEGLKHCAFEHQLDLANLVGKLDPGVCRHLLNDGPLRRDQTSKIAMQFQKFTKVEKQLFLRFPIGRIAKKECNPDEDSETSDKKHLIHPDKKIALGKNG